MSTKKIKEYLLQEIEKTEIKCNKIIGEIRVLEQYYDLNGQSLAGKILNNSTAKSIKDQAAKVNEMEERIEILKKTLELEVSRLASKKANLHWIDDSSEYE